MQSAWSRLRGPRAVTTSTHPAPGPGAPGCLFLLAWLISQTAPPPAPLIPVETELPLLASDHQPHRFLISLLGHASTCRAFVTAEMRCDGQASVIQAFLWPGDSLLPKETGLGNPAPCQHGSAPMGAGRESWWDRAGGPGTGEKRPRGQQCLRAEARCLRVPILSLVACPRWRGPTAGRPRVTAPTHRRLPASTAQAERGNGDTGPYGAVPMGGT